MNDIRRKRLTGFLGECDRNCISCAHSPSNCGKFRTFSTAQDMVDLAKQLVKMGKWNDFYGLAQRHYKKSKLLIWKYVDESDVAEWLITNPACFCELVGEFLEAGSCPGL